MIAVLVFPRMSTHVSLSRFTVVRMFRPRYKVAWVSVLLSAKILLRDTPAVSGAGHGQVRAVSLSLNFPSAKVRLGRRINLLPFLVSTQHFHRINSNYQHMM